MDGEADGIHTSPIFQKQKLYTPSMLEFQCHAPYCSMSRVIVACGFEPALHVDTCATVIVSYMLLHALDGSPDDMDCVFN